MAAPTKKPLTENLPALLGGIAAILTALTGMVVALVTVFSAKPAAAPAPTERASAREAAAAPAVGAEAPGPSGAAGSDRVAEVEAKHAPLARPSAPAEEPRPAPSPAPSPYSEADWQRAVTATGVDEAYVRATAERDGAVVDRVTRKDVVHVMQLKDGWWEARLPSGKRGYVMRRR